MKKYIRNTLWVTVILIVLLLISAGAVWLWSLRSYEDGSGVPGTAVISGEIPAVPGETLTAGVEFSLPLWQRVIKSTARPGRGAALTAGQETISSSWRWTRRIWRISVPMRPYRTGNIPAGSIDFEISGRNGKTISAAAEIPAFEVKSPDPATAGGELMLAEAASAAAGKSKVRYLYYAAAAAAVLLAVLWSFLRRRKKHPVRRRPVWESTLDALRDLLNEVKNRDLPPETGIVRLTDLVRHYLEKRFRLPATRRTTAEFLGDLQQSSSPLDENGRTFLHDFMLAADLVKFARAAADTAMLADAVNRAEDLVRSTIPAEDEQKKRQKNSVTEGENAGTGGEK